MFNIKKVINIQEYSRNYLGQQQELDVFICSLT
jgi:hypothetical protein